MTDLNENTLAVSGSIDSDTIVKIANLALKARRVYYDSGYCHGTGSYNKSWLTSAREACDDEDTAILVFQLVCSPEDSQNRRIDWACEVAGKTRW